ncbi:hypothetical protein ACFX16_013817 [Malus domestica]
MEATGWSFKARYNGKGNQNATQSYYVKPQRLRKQFLTPHIDVTAKRKLWLKGTTQRNLVAVSCTAPHGSTPSRENCGQKALHSETSLQSLAQAHPRPATTALKASRRSWRQALPSQD